MAISQSAEHRPAEIPAVWAASCADIVEKLDDPALPDSISSSLSTLMPFDECRQVVYVRTGAPILVFDSLRGAPHPGMAHYLAGSYVINPTYRMFRQGKLGGAHRLRDVPRVEPSKVDQARYRVHALEDEEIGFVTEGMPTGTEELCLGLDMPSGACAVISLSRVRSAGGFSDREVERVGAVLPFLTSAFRRYWTRSRQPAKRVPAEFQLFSPREHQVAEMLMEGHSTLSISLHLDVSVTTIKTHRKNLYAKLGISTQFELYKLCVATFRQNG